MIEFFPANLSIFPANRLLESKVKIFSGNLFGVNGLLLVDLMADPGRLRGCWPPTGGSWSAAEFHPGLPRGQWVPPDQPRDNGRLLIGRGVDGRPSDQPWDQGATPGRPRGRCMPPGPPRGRRMEWRGD